MNQLLKGDCLDLMKTLADNSIDAIVTDPPYGLEFMGKEWDKGVPALEFWVEMLRILKPGGHLLSFSGTRTYHRMAVNIEDAGFEIRDMIEWVYGSGFPKSLNIGKAVDKLQGNEREVVGDNIRLGDKKAYDKNPQNPFFHTDNISTMGKITKGTSEWEGWGTSLKPSHEPICMARKPLEKGLTVAENCLKWGTGGINIDESRVEYTSEKDKKEGQSARPSKTSNANEYALNHGCLEGMDRSDRSDISGRFPANLIHDNSEEVRECFPETKTGTIKPYKHANRNNTCYGEQPEYVTFDREGDSGNASRFFKSIIYQAKASKSERGLSNNHPTVKPTALMEYLINMVSKENAIVLDPFGGSCTTAIACLNTKRKYICMEKDDSYYEIGLKRVLDWLKKNETNIFK